MDDEDYSVSSLYWKIPDQSDYLSAVAAHETDPLIAVASGSSKSNLFIYELKVNSREDTLLTHHQTITLPGIHSLSWVSPRHRLGSYGNLLASGHNSGLVHLTLLPDINSETKEPAEIVKRFNHNKHMPKDCISSARIKSLCIIDSSWCCAPPSSIMSLFSEHLFLWDPRRSDIPALKKKVRGAIAFDASETRDGLVAIAGSKGISILDVRVKDSNGLSPPDDNNGHCSHVKWSPQQQNTLASVHDSSIVKVWDIRSTGPMLVLDNHTDKINSIQWSTTDNDKFQTASNDGTIRHWSVRDSLFQQEQHKHQTTVASKTDEQAAWLSPQWKLYRQRLSRCEREYNDQYFMDKNSHGSKPNITVFSALKQFTSLTTIKCLEKETLISLDSDGFFGLHLDSFGKSLRKRPSSESFALTDASSSMMEDDGRSVSSNSTISPPCSPVYPVPQCASDRYLKKSIVLESDRFDGTKAYDEEFRL